MLIQIQFLQVSYFELEEWTNGKKKNPKPQTSLLTPTEKNPKKPKTKQQPTSPKLPLGKEWCDHVMKQF